MKSRSYPAQNIKNTDYAADIALLVNTPPQAVSQLRSLEQAACGIRLQMK